jgi:uncharacterized protein YqiB (DUF1249 family)
MKKHWKPFLTHINHYSNNPNYTPPVVGEIPSPRSSLPARRTARHRGKSCRRDPGEMGGGAGLYIPKNTARKRISLWKCATLVMTSWQQWSAKVVEQWHCRCKVKLTQALRHPSASATQLPQLTNRLLHRSTFLSERASLQGLRRWRHDQWTYAEAKNLLPENGNDLRHILARWMALDQSGFYRFWINQELRQHQWQALHAEDTAILYGTVVILWGSLAT